MISDLKHEKSDCPWILKHPFRSSNFQLCILLAEVFIAGMIVGARIIS